MPARWNIASWRWNADTGVYNRLYTVYGTLYPLNMNIPCVGLNQYILLLVRPVFILKSTKCLKEFLKHHTLE